MSAGGRAPPPLRSTLAMCLCKAFETLGYLLVCALVVVVGGYVGKGLYLANDPSANWHAHEIASGEFWEPDYTFWLFGFLSLALLLALSFTIWLLLEGLQQCLRLVFCNLFCWCWGCLGGPGSEDELDDFTQLLDDSERGRGKARGRRRGKGHGRDTGRRDGRASRGRSESPGAASSDSDPEDSRENFDTDRNNISGPPPPRKSNYTF